MNPPENPKKSETRFLPDDPKEQDAILARYAPLVRPALNLVSRSLKAADVAELDKDEKNDGVFAFSALLHQYGASLDARILVLVWIASVVLFRLPTFLENRKKEKAVAAAKAVNVPPTPVPPNPNTDTAT